MEVPSIFTVAPMGKTKLEIDLGTPTFSSTHSIVTGRVAALELVEKAKNCAGLMFLKKSLKLILETNDFTIKG